MFKIVEKKTLAPQIVEMSVKAPLIAQSALPGQFLIVKTDKYGERIPLTICDVNKEQGLVVIVFQVVGYSTKQMATLNQGDMFLDVVGPLGKPSELVKEPLEQLKRKNILFVAGGVGTAPVYPQVKFLHQIHLKADVIIGAKNKEMVIYQENMKKVAGNLYIATDDGSEGLKGFVTDKLKDLVENQGKKYDLVVAIGPMIMMKNVVALTKQYNIKTIVSLNSLMVDGTGMCGACRVTVGGQTKFTCVDGPEFDGFEIDFSEAMSRQAMYCNVEKRTIIEQEEQAQDHHCHIGGITQEQPDRKKRVPVRERAAADRAKSFKEVCYGYNEQEAVEEAKRCLQCKKPLCVTGCPVTIHIPEFIFEIARGEFEKASQVLAKSTLLPAVCGRVCPQESQCEGKCVLGKKGDPVSIGKLERFVADWARHQQIKPEKPTIQLGKKVAIIGSGPAGLTCAADLARMGYKVTVFEALHEPGGVLMYGIPEFRLPKQEVVEFEVNNVLQMGVDIETNVVIGRTMSIDDLMTKQGFEAVFIASGAGLPKFMNIKGENFNGVVSANEFLTRNNLMRSFDAVYQTPNYVGKKVAVVGGGNVAMDAARTALRLGAEVTVVYRRSEEELPARVEEVHHAKEEGIKFNLLTNPVEILADQNKWVNAMVVRKMELGEPDQSGRRSPKEIIGSDYQMPVDMVIMSIGTAPNPLIKNTTANLEANRRGCIVADDDGQTSRPGVFAGGDAVSGAATVILAMGAARKAAIAIDNYLKAKK